MTKSFHLGIVAAIGITISSSVFASEPTPAVKRDVRRGRNAALFAIHPGQSFPSSAMRVFMSEEKKHAKESAAFQLGFAQSICSHMHTAYDFALSLPGEELQQAGTGWVIYSGKATLLQAQMHLTDAQMVELFSAEGFRKIQKKPGPL